ncbi:capsule biosynthesis protein [Gluconacetobacter diazotrophicus]|uniref:capsule biosynthesis protein n=1 Tax=Gluconacetobacter diazotrophicus TaxID=33996 RepID=UPI001E2D36F7|nr:capsule biosynthesis protein [Gluconacetobacter diazotrophicus]
MASALVAIPRGFNREHRLRKARPFLLVVALPTLIAAIYYFLIAAPQYVSQAEFVVRGAASQPVGMLSNLLTPGEGSVADEDSYIVQDYLTSRDAAKTMLATKRLAAIFNRPEGDRFARFPNVFTGSSFEYFYQYYKNHVTVELDTSTSIATLRVRTFRAQDSQDIATALLVSAEQLVNQINMRQRANMIGSAVKEVEEATEQLRDVEGQLAAYRNREALLDPIKQATPLLSNINELQVMLTSARMQLAQVQTASPRSPAIPVYQRRIAILEEQIARLSRDVTGSKASLVPKITDYDALTFKQELIEKQLTAAATALETAKAQADRQQVYLEQISHPDLADYATYPKRISDVLTVFATFLGLFLMGKLIISGAREHQIV